MFVKSHHGCLLSLAPSEYPDCKELVIVYSKQKSKKKMETITLEIVLTEKNIADLERMFKAAGKRRKK